MEKSKFHKLLRLLRKIQKQAPKKIWKWTGTVLGVLAVICLSVMVVRSFLTPPDANDPTAPSGQQTSPTELYLPPEEIPEYIREEAHQVVQKLNKDAFLLAVVSDTHVGTGADDNGSNTHAAKLTSFGLQTIQGEQKLDMLAILGDYTMAGDTYEKETLLQDLAMNREIFRPVTSQLPTAFLQGNHDVNHYANAANPDVPRLTQQEIYENLGKNNTVGTLDPQNPKGNYGFADFEEHKLRVIYMNTCESETYEIGISKKQLCWLAEQALNVTGKDDGDQWSILILSHHPLNWNFRTDYVIKMLEDYQAGVAGFVSYTHDGAQGQLDYDFGKMEQRATIVANIHGHVHNFGSGYMGKDNWLLRIAVPNTSMDRNNQYDGEFAESNEEEQKIYWEKKPNSENGTSFCLVSLDVRQQTIRLSCFGAGYDREFTYRSHKK